MRSDAAQILSSMATIKRKQRKRESVVLESVPALGAVVGLLTVTAAPKPAEPCSGGLGTCVGKSMTSALMPYVTHAIAGALLGTMLALLLIYAWRGRVQTSGGGAAVRRQAIPERVRHEVWRRDRGTCVECGSRGRLEFDHIIPVSRGGANTARNIELRCEPCNRRKGARV
jgi:hypothetical protein